MKFKDFFVNDLTKILTMIDSQYIFRVNVKT